MFPCFCQICIPTPNHLTCFSISQTSHTPCGPLPNGFHLSARLRNYSSKTITSSDGNQRSPLPFVTTKPISHSPCFLVQLLSVPPTRWLSALLQFWPVNVTNHQMMSSIHIRCHVFGHLVLFRACDSSFTNGVNRR